MASKNNPPSDKTPVVVTPVEKKGDGNEPSYTEFDYTGGVETFKDKNIYKQSITLDITDHACARRISMDVTPEMNGCSVYQENETGASMVSNNIYVFGTKENPVKNCKFNQLENQYHFVQLRNAHNNSIKQFTSEDPIVVLEENVVGNKIEQISSAYANGSILCIKPDPTTHDNKFSAGVDFKQGNYVYFMEGKRSDYEFTFHKNSFTVVYKPNGASPGTFENYTVCMFGCPGEYPEIVSVKELKKQQAKTDAAKALEDKPKLPVQEQKEQPSPPSNGTANPASSQQISH